MSSHKIGAVTASTFVIANMIGTGVFTSLGFQLLATTNPYFIAFIWLIGGICALCGAIVYSELGAAMPHSGGEYNFLSRIYTPRLGFMSGWASMIVGFAAPVALACMALSHYICNIYPSVNPMALGLGVLTVLTLIHATDAHLGEKTQNVLTVFKILIIVVFIVAGFLAPADGAANFVGAGDFKMSDFFSSAIGVSLIWVYYAYSGWNAAAYIAGDIRDPHKNVPLALLCSTAFCIILYLCLNIVFIRTTPVPELAGQVEIGLISARHIFGDEGGNLMGLLIALMLVSSISSMVYVGPRVGEAMGKDHRFFRMLSRRNKRHSPMIAIWVQWAICVVMILTDSFQVITQYTGVVISLCAMLTVAGVFVHRWRYPNSKRPYRTFLYPITPIVFCAVILFSIMYMIYDDYEKTYILHSQDLMWTTIASALTLVSGAFVYDLQKKHNKRRDKKLKKLQNHEKK